MSNIEKVAKAEKLIAKGMTMTAAADKVGITHSSISYYRNKKATGNGKIAGPKSEVQVHQFPDTPKRKYVRKDAVKTSTPMVAVFGTAEQIAEAIKNVGQ